MALPDETLKINTPENVVFGYEIAGIGSRFLAALVDTLIISVIEILAGLALLIFLNHFLSEAFKTLGGWLIAVSSLLAFAIFWGYYIFFETAWNGQSPGKRWVKLRVIRMDGTPITVAEAIIRNLVRLVDFMPAYYGVGVVVMFIGEHSQRLGDLAAGTLVVRDRGSITLESLESKPETEVELPDSLAPAQNWPVERLTAADLRLAEDFLRRRKELANRAELAQRILQALLARMELAELQPSPSEAEKLIVEILQAQRARG